MVSKKLFEQVKADASRSFGSLHKLCEQEEKQYGYTHNDKDLDQIIDSLDYGTGDMTFEEYEELMKGAKEYDSDSELKE